MPLGCCDILDGPSIPTPCQRGTGLRWGLSITVTDDPLQQVCNQQSMECRYGVGQIYFRQEKYEMAEYHFRRSLLINPRSSVLRCYVGLALHKINRFQDALEQLQVRTA